MWTGRYDNTYVYDNGFHHRHRCHLQILLTTMMPSSIHVHLLFALDDDFIACLIDVIFLVSTCVHEYHNLVYHVVVSWLQLHILSSSHLEAYVVATKNPPPLIYTSHIGSSFFQEFGFVSVVPIVHSDCNSIMMVHLLKYVIVSSSDFKKMKKGFVAFLCVVVLKMREYIASALRTPPTAFCCYWVTDWNWVLRLLVLSRSFFLDMILRVSLLHICF